MTDPAFQDIEKFLSEVIGLDADSIGKKSVRDSVAAAMESARIADAGQYLKVLRTNAQELERLIERLTVPETWFFRDEESFTFLRKYLREKDLHTSGREDLRILSAPCSTGEEAYSIAMALLQAGIPSERFRIDAVDINPRAIETAKQAAYSRASFRGEKQDYRDRYFTFSEGLYRLDPRIAALVRFSTANLVQHDTLRNLEPYHVIFCKNLLIYLSEAARGNLAKNIDRLLVPYGLLFTGHSEVMAFLQYGFTPVKHTRSFACVKTAYTIEQSRVPTKKKMTGPARTPEASIAKRNRGAPEMPSATNSPGKSEERDQQRPSGQALAEIRGLADRGALEEAGLRCEQFLKGHSRSKEGYCLMGLINTALDSFDRAEEFFQKALYLDPDYYEALVHLGLLYEKKGDKGKSAVIRARIERFRKAGAGRHEAL
jgi:chemotaxis protein methyltransferase WspC